MKKNMRKIGIMLLLVAILVAAGVYPLTSSQAAAKTITYNVEILKGSKSLSLASVNGGGAAVSGSDNVGMSFKMVVTQKAAKDKGGSYYPVTIPAKGVKYPSSEAKMPGGTTAVTISTVTKDGTGKLYFNGGNVNVSSVVGKKLTTTIGADGQAGSANSLVVNLNSMVVSTIKETGKTYLKMPAAFTFTTGTAYIVCQGIKGSLNGKALPDNDTSKTLPKPLVGVPLDFNAGTGTLVGVGGATGLKSGIGLLDWIEGTIYLMKITQ
jgi:hypothetical protein